MSFEVKTTNLFIKRLKPLLRKYASLSMDLNALAVELADTPRIGDSLGKNCYKVRMAVRSKSFGKSGGARIITLVQVQNGRVLLLTIYDKSEREDLRPNELQELLSSLE